MGTTKTIPEMRDIICNEMKEIYDRSEGEDEIREVLQLERSMESECDGRDKDARVIIRGMTERLEQQRREIETPSEEAFVAEVRRLEKERARASERINQQLEEAAAQEKDIERMQLATQETKVEIERTVEAHTVDLPRVQNAIGLYTNITNIKWNYETEGDIVAGWLVPSAAGRGGGGSGGGGGKAGHGAVVEGFQFDATGKSDFEVANKLWDVIDGKTRALVEA